MKSLSLLCLSILSAVNSAHASPLTAETSAKLASLRTAIRTWAPLCADGVMTNDGRLNPDGTKKNCPMGDTTIFAGLLCLSGEKDRCEDVRKAQDASGRWWRAPGLVGIETGGPSFSRDQSKGAIAYLLATHDVDAAGRWSQFISANGNRFCPKGTNDDGPCDPREAFWIESQGVYQYLGLPPIKKVGRLNRWFISVYNPFEASMQPHDYPMHLTAASLYIGQELEKRGGDIDHQGNTKNAHIIANREPHNPFFHYLANGIDEEGANLILDVCPLKAPHPEGTSPDWIWQRGYGLKVDGDSGIRWTYPSGWDCIFAINLYLGAEQQPVKP